MHDASMAQLLTAMASLVAGRPTGPPGDISTGESVGRPEE